MALTGRFLADFESFYAAVQKADVQLRGLETGAGKVSTSLNKMVDSFSGRKIIQDATLAAEAVERIGGASKLTAAEQARVNATVTEALAKYKALGEQAPQALRDLEQATRKAENKTRDWVTSLSGLAGAFGIAFSVGAVVNFGKKVFDSASQIHDLAEQLGISTDAVQGFKFAAEQSGSSLDAVGTAITKMNQKLSVGDKSTVGALQDAGLSFNAIRNMKPEDAFLAIADAVQKIPDPMKQSEVALALFGKGAAELLPGIKEGFRGAADAASKMSAETIRSLEAAQDAWGKLTDKVIIASGTIIAHTMAITTQITSSWKDVADFAANAMKFGIGAASAMADAKSAAGQMGKDINLSLPTKPIIELTDAQKKAADAANAHALAIKALADAYSGATAIKAANDALAAVNLNLRAGITIAQMTRDEQDALNKTVTAGIAAYTAIGRVAPSALRSIASQTTDVTKLGPKIEEIGTVFKGVGDQIRLIPPPLAETLTYMNGLPLDTFKVLGDSVKPVPPKIKEVTNNVLEFAGVLSQLGHEVGGITGQMLSGIGSLASAWGSSIAAVKAYQAAAAAAKLAGTQAPSQGPLIAGGISTAAGLFLMGKGLIDQWDAAKRAVSQARLEIIQTAGGFRELQAQAQLAGIAIKDAYSFDPDRVTDALQRQNDLMARYNLTWRDFGNTQQFVNTQTSRLLADFRLLTTAGMNSDKALMAMSGSLSQLVVDAVKTGTKIPVALQPILEKLIKMGGLTDAAARAMLGLADDSMPALSDITDAASRYGLKLDQLGPKVKQLSITTQANQIIKDFKILSDAGASYGVVLGAMKPQFQELVNAALTAGVALPIAMKPWLQSMVDAGELTDADGNKLKDLSGINFAEPLTASIDRLIAKLDDWIDKLSGVGDEFERMGSRARGALEQIGTAVPRPLPGEALPETGTPEAPTGGTAVPREGIRASGNPIAGRTYAAGTQGAYLNFGAGTLAMLHGRERVMTESEGRRGGGEQTIRVPVYLDSRLIAEAVVPQIPEVVKSYGLA